MSDSATVVRPKTFLDLPPEIRDVIYELVLVETPRHERRHTATCDWSKLPASHEKRSLLESIGTGSGIGPNPPVPCRCAKRKNLAILSVNRQIYNESSYVLWTKNVFSFDWVKDFNYWFADISAAKRNLIRHIAIYYVQGLIFPEETIEADDIDELQSNLLQCTDLRTLDLSPFCMYKEYIALLCRQLPLLQRLRMAGFVVVHSGHLGAAKSVPALAWGLVHEDIRIDDDEEVGVDIVDEEEEEEGSSSSSTTTTFVLSRWGAEGVARWKQRISALQKELGALDPDSWRDYYDVHHWEEHRTMNSVLAGRGHFGSSMPNSLGARLNEQARIHMGLLDILRRMAPE
ncbi:hypothetical protein PG991_012527 [Apiospora marii]|uniref:DUF7730 domain-containing protein n=1 Tax=Apiospora marii TaxID=335849 RepID=A0ABR1RA30_9PEZI